jgi:hypothetical protein
MNFPFAIPAGLVVYTPLADNADYDFH